MTGYAVATSEGAAGTLTIEIKSVNSRFLDLQFRINDELRALEPDLRAAIMAAITRGKVEARLSFGRKVAGGVRMLVVPGSMRVKAQAESEGLSEVFLAAGAEWREAGCSMCLGMMGASSPGWRSASALGRYSLMATALPSASYAR